MRAERRYVRPDRAVASVPSAFSAGRTRGLDPPPPATAVRFGDDVAVGIDHKARAGRLLAADDDVGVAATRATLIARPVAADQNLHNTGPDLLGERVDRLVHPHERILRGWGWLLLSRLRRRGRQEDESGA